MANCSICKSRVDLSKTGVRIQKCLSCSKIVCQDHYHKAEGKCSLCLGYPIAKGGRPFSFIRKSKS